MSEAIDVTTMFRAFAAANDAIKESGKSETSFQKFVEQMAARGFRVLLVPIEPQSVPQGSLEV
jgi:hypothetical protein